MEFPNILLKNVGTPDSTRIDRYLKSGGYRALEKALKGMSPESVLEEVKRSNVRGRGGAGFPAGLKWGFIPKESEKPRYLCCNADEGEPGTFKDRVIMENDPHLLLEGMILCSYAVGAHLAYIYIRGEFSEAARILERAVEEAREKGFIGTGVLGTDFDIDIIVFRGAGAYICGEETALLESIEGKPGQPRLRPPFPATIGLFQGPTVINNVETLSSIPWIIEHGGEQYAAIGTEYSAGTKLFCISGHVNKPGVYELPMGYPFMKLLESEAGGMKDNKRFKAVFPGGTSVPVLRAEDVQDLNLDYESLTSAGSMLGSGAVIVMNEETCMVKTTLIITRFFVHESCGKCTPCRLGNTVLLNILERLTGGEGQPGDLERLEELGRRMQSSALCGLGQTAANALLSTMKLFRDEYEEHLESERCPAGWCRKSEPTKNTA